MVVKLFIFPVCFRSVNKGPFVFQLQSEWVKLGLLILRIFQFCYALMPVFELMKLIWKHCFRNITILSCVYIVIYVFILNSNNQITTRLNPDLLCVKLMVLYSFNPWKSSLQPLLSFIGVKLWCWTAGAKLNKVGTICDQKTRHI